MQSTWEPIGTFVFEDGTINEALMEYANDNSEPFNVYNTKKHQESTAFSVLKPPKCKSCRYTRKTKETLVSIHQTREW